MSSNPNHSRSCDQANEGTMNIVNTVAALLSLDLGIAQPDNLKLLEQLSEHYPIELLRFPSGREHNGWVVPPEWKVRKALISRNGEILFDGTVHPLAVARNSISFRGTIDKATLDSHIFYKRDRPDTYVYHNLFTLRPWIQDWGMCVPYSVYQNWPDGEYDIDLVTEHLPGEMLVGIMHREGDIADTIVFNAHTCHPCQANDDLAGVVMLVKLFRWLARSTTRYNYLGVLAPEHLGTVFYTADLDKKRLQACKAGVFVEMPGARKPLAVQASFHGNTGVDRVARNAVARIEAEPVFAPFRTLAGNDETVWEAPGVDVPMVSLQRYLPEEYHTSDDTAESLSSDALESSFQALCDMVRIYEYDYIPVRKFEGLLCLSNPKYNLYTERKKAYERGKVYAERDKRLGMLQNTLPQYMDGANSVLDIAELSGLDFFSVKEYVDKYVSAGLVEQRPVDGLDHYERSGR